MILLTFPSAILQENYILVFGFSVIFVNGARVGFERAQISLV